MASAGVARTAVTYNILMYVDHGHDHHHTAASSSPHPHHHHPRALGGCHSAAAATRLPLRPRRLTPAGHACVCCVCAVCVHVCAVCAVWGAWACDGRWAAVSPSVSSLSHTAGELQKWEAAEAWLQDMRRDGLSPDAVTYSILIRAAGKCLQLDAAFDAFREHQHDAAEAMAAVQRDEGGVLIAADDEPLALRRALELQVSATQYGTLIAACEQCGQLERAFDVFDEMEQRGFAPNAPT
jgi:pentatricopeptide repeat protein